MAETELEVILELFPLPVFTALVQAPEACDSILELEFLRGGREAFGLAGSRTTLRLELYGL